MSTDSNSNDSHSSDVAVSQKSWRPECKKPRIGTTGDADADADAGPQLAAFAQVNDVPLSRLALSDRPSPFSSSSSSSSSTPPPTVTAASGPSSGPHADASSAPVAAAAASGATVAPNVLEGVKRPKEQLLKASTSLDSEMPARLAALKRRANDAFEAKQYVTAVRLYSDAITQLSFSPRANVQRATYSMPASLHSFFECFSYCNYTELHLRCAVLCCVAGTSRSKAMETESKSRWLSVLLANRAAALLKRAWESDAYAALSDCHRALALNPLNIKAHYRFIRCRLDSLSSPLFARRSSALLYYTGTVQCTCRIEYTCSTALHVKGVC